MPNIDRRRFNGAKVKPSERKLTERFTLICSPEFKEMIFKYRPYNTTNARWLRQLLISGSKQTVLTSSLDLDYKTCRISIRLNPVDAALISDRSAEGIRQRITTGLMITLGKDIDRVKFLASLYDHRYKNYI